MSHLAKLVDGTHILCGTNISFNKLEDSKVLLNSFVENFEKLYGEKNMVHNVHLLIHLPDCVRLNGPLYTYSNYCFEDHIGHLVSLKRGTTDVATQICQKYVLEKNLFHYAHGSPTINKFIKEIDSKQQFSICRKISGSQVIGKPINNSDLTDLERALIQRILKTKNDTQITEYNSVLLNCKSFYEALRCTANKRTNDSFIFNMQSNRFASIKSIFVINEELFFLIDEKFEIIHDEKYYCEHIHFLKELDIYKQNIIKVNSIGPKYALVKFDEIITCSKFPNTYERN